jgi:general secretion pathway protein K
MPQGFPRHQRGVALITAVLIVALATILAVNVTFSGMLDQRRSASLFAFDQGYEVALGAEAWAADILKKDAQESPGKDNLSEMWAQALPPLPIDDNVGTIEGRLEDMQGRFNLNSLVNKTDGSTEPKAVHRLERILQLVDVEPTWATIIADWVDVNADPNCPDGAEDPTYLGEDPPHLAANMPITRTSELLALPGFGIDRYRKLAPVVTALPVGTGLNVCTAKAPVLDSLTEEDNFSLMDPVEFAKRQKEACYPGLDGLPQITDQDVRTSLSESSSYFRATIWVTIGTTQFTLYSLLNRGGGGVVRPVLRSFGAE